LGSGYTTKKYCQGFLKRGIPLSDKKLENGKILIFICSVALRDKNVKTTLQEESNLLKPFLPLFRNRD
jgi:hypothetical protein